MILKKKQRYLSYSHPRFTMFTSTIHSPTQIKIVLDELNLHYNRLARINQIHSNKVLNVSEAGFFGDCDGLITHEKYNLIEFDELVVKSDILLAIGGDGTILSTVRRLGDNQKPIMGIHIGDLIYDYHLMKNRVPTVDINDHRFQESLKLAL